MDIKNKTIEILDLVREKVLSPDEALPQILLLFSVVGRSEQLTCLHPYDKVEQNDSGEIVCKECNEQLAS